MFRKTLAVTLFVSTIAATAGPQYTKQQLNRMAAAGQYPSQGPVIDKQVRPMTFSSCKRVAESVMSQLRGSYPVETIVDTKIMYMVKSWANDGVTLVTCSQPDSTLVLTRADYS